MNKHYDPRYGEDDWQKVGSCNQCCSCCDPYCPAMTWIALRDIRQGEAVKPGLTHGQIRSVCAAWNTDQDVNGCTRFVREGFPHSCHSTPIQCGFDWVLKAEVKRLGD